MNAYISFSVCCEVGWKQVIPNALVRVVVELIVTISRIVTTSYN